MSPMIQCRRCLGHVRPEHATFDGLCPTCMEWEAKLAPVIERREREQQTAPKRRKRANA